MGKVKRGRIVIYMDVRVRSVDMRHDEKGVFPFRPPHTEVVADVESLFGCDLAPLERLAYLVTDNIVVLILLPVRDCEVLRFRESKFFIGGFVVALVGAYQLPAVGLVFVLPVVETVGERFGYGLPFARVMLFKIYGSHARLPLS